jgi:S1-C subfamily serine protease
MDKLENKKIINKGAIFLFIIFCFIIILFSFFINWRPLQITADNIRFDDQEATILAIKKIIPAVVSIIIYEQQDIVSYNIETKEQIKKNEKIQKGSGTGFLISADGLILTNKHVAGVVNEKTSVFKIILNSGKQYYAQLIGKDPINDLAVLKIFDKNLPYVELGDSDQLQIGSTVIAIGNALGRYQNSATKGIVSGLGRSILASDQEGNFEDLDNVIQTDAEINLGNSGGPLIDLSGKVVGVNVAIDGSGTSIGFAIPINDAKPVIRTVKQIGRIVRPRLGIRYLMLTPEIAQEKNLKRTSGAYISAGEDGDPAVMLNSPAAAAGVESGDIIIEINGIKLEGKTTLLAVVQKYKPGDIIGLRILRGDKIINKIAILDEFK